MKQEELIPHLFRTEYSKICSVLTALFGIEHIEIAEDIASETFASALESWPYKGIPENPVAWLYTVSKNKTRNYLHRNKVFSEKIKPELLLNEKTSSEPIFSDQVISDSQLQMLFAICRPSIPVEAQIGLALRTLCGFGIEEIAIAFLSNKDTINKRLYRAREKLREEKTAFELPEDSQIEERLDTVLATLYLLFSEGYFSETREEVIREELCQEAIRLTELILQNPKTAQPKVHALYALFCFQSSRFKSRKKGDQSTALYEDQDRSLWDSEKISLGALHLNKASTGNVLSKYHLEAGIAFHLTIKEDTKEKWEKILLLYNYLLQLEYSPIAALGRAYTYSKIHETEAAILEAEKLNLKENYFYYSLLGNLYKEVNPLKARLALEQALHLAKTESQKSRLRKELSLI